MRNIKTILLSGILTLGVFSLIFYTSCSKKDKCDSITCQNGGHCEEGSCVCPLGYEGVNCENAAVDNFVGSFSAHDDCILPDTTRDYQVTIRKDNDSTIYINELANISSAPNYTLTAHLETNDKFTISSQTLPDSRIYSGSLNYQDGNTLKAKFVIKDTNDNIVETCTSTLSK